MVYAIEDDRLVVIVGRVAGRGKAYRDIWLARPLSWRLARCDGAAWTGQRPSRNARTATASQPGLSTADERNQIEIWNGIITRKLIRCGTFKSEFVKHWNSDCKPMKWTATAEEIIDKVRAITAHMEALLRATEIGDVASQAA